MNLEISKAMDALEEKLRRSRYSPETVSALRKEWALFRGHAEQRGCKTLTEELVEDYVRENRLIDETGRCGCAPRAIAMLCEEGGLRHEALAARSKRRGRRKKHFVPARFEEDYLDYLEFSERLGLSAGTLSARESAARHFLSFLGGRVELLSELTIEDCDAFIRERSKTCGKRTIAMDRSRMRSLVSFLEERHSLHDVLLTLSADKDKTPGRTLQRFLTEEEVARMLEAAPHTGATPKRTLAIITMLLQYMMRGKDLREMTLDDIDWSAGTIRVRSSKTGAEKTFPLTETLRYEILDYLKNERPRSESRNLFLSVRYPFGPMKTNAALIATIQRVARKAGVDPKKCRLGCHTLRRTGATMMMADGVDYATISDVLMHETGQGGPSLVTMAYLRVDVERLRLAALEVM